MWSLQCSADVINNVWKIDTSKVLSSLLVWVCGNTDRDHDHTCDENAVCSVWRVTAAEVCCSLTTLIIVNTALVSHRPKVICDRLQDWMLAACS